MKYFGAPYASYGFDMVAADMFGLFNDPSTAACGVWKDNRTWVQLYNGTWPEEPRYVPPAGNVACCEFAFHAVPWTLHAAWQVRRRAAPLAALVPLRAAGALATAEARAEL